MLPPARLSLAFGAPMITHEGRGRKTSPRRHAPDSSPEMRAFLYTLFEECDPDTVSLVFYVHAEHKRRGNPSGQLATLAWQPEVLRCSHRHRICGDPVQGRFRAVLAEASGTPWSASYFSDSVLAALLTMTCGLGQRNLSLVRCSHPPRRPGDGHPNRRRDFLPSHSAPVLTSLV